jgi:hypothetical protein
MGVVYVIILGRSTMYRLLSTGAFCAAFCVGSVFVMPSSLSAEEQNDWIADAYSVAYVRSATAETSSIAYPPSSPASYDENTSFLVHVYAARQIGDVVSTGSISPPGAVQSASATAEANSTNYPPSSLASYDENTSFLAHVYAAR